MTSSPTTSGLDIGALNGHAVGIILKELVRRAMRIIQAKRLIFEARAKDSPGRPDDLVTDADEAAQDRYVTSLKECFPGFGIIAEEHDHREPCTIPGRQLYAIIDPLDGTKAFGRRQSTGVATQIALVDFDTGQVLSAFVGDINTGEIYGYRPDSINVHRITDLVHSEKLSAIGRGQPLTKQVAILREHPSTYSWLIRRLVSPATNGLVKHILIDNGSMSVMFARLWKGEVGLLVNEPYNDTPWDCAPVFGISHTLGFVALAPDPKRATFEPFSAITPREVRWRSHEVVWVHQTRLAELQSWAARQHI